MSRGLLFWVVLVGVLGLPGSQVFGSGAAEHVGRTLLDEEERKCTTELENVCRDVEEKQCSGAKKQNCFQVPVEDCGPEDTQNCWMETRRGCTKPENPKCQIVRRQQCGTQSLGSECRTVVQNRCRTIPRESCPPEEQCKLVRTGGCNGKKLLTYLKHKKPPPPPPPPRHSPRPPSPPPPRPSPTPPPPRPAPAPTQKPQPSSSDDDDDDGGDDDDDDGDDGGDSPGTTFQINIQPKNPIVLNRRDTPRVLGNFLDCDAQWERECQQVPATSDCQDCSPVEEVICEDQPPSNDCKIVEEEVCEPVEEKCEDIQVQRCQTLRQDVCKTVMKEECRPADGGDDDDDDEDCETKTVKKCGMEERERCVLGKSAFEHAIQSVNVKLAAEFVEGNRDPAVIADALSVKPEDKERALRKTPERVRDPDVIVGKAFAKAVLDAENTQVIADKLAKVAIETIIQDVWKVQFFVDLKQLERNLRTVYADRTAMEAVSQANPATDLLPKLGNPGRKLKCVNCTPLHSLMCAHCWPINVCGEFWWCPAQ